MANFSPLSGGTEGGKIATSRRWGVVDWGDPAFTWRVGGVGRPGLYPGGKRGGTVGPGPEVDRVRRPGGAGELARGGFYG